MSRGLVSLALLGLLAGCAAPAAETALLPSTVADALTVPLLATLNSVIDPEGGQGEPSLGVAPDGTLFTHGVSSRGLPTAGLPASGLLNRGGGTVYRSSDAGLTWEAVATPHAAPDLDPDLAVDVDGTVWDDILYVGCNSVAVSRDNGETWSVNPVVCGGPVHDRQYVIPTKGGTAYLYSHQIPTFQQTGMKTTDHGATWTPLGPIEGTEPHHLLVDEGSGWGGGGFWNAAADSVFFTYTWFEGGLFDGAWSPAASVTRDGGLTFEVTKAATAGGASLGLSLVVGAADAAGDAYLAWAETVGENTTGIFLASSADEGATWSAPKRVDAGTGGVILPAIAALGSGEVAVAYYEADVPTLPDDAEDGVSWHVTLATAGDATADAPAWSYGRLSQAPAKVGPLCTSGAGCDGDRELLDYFSVKFLPDGRVASIWTSTEAVEEKTVNLYAATDLPVFPAEG